MIHLNRNLGNEEFPESFTGTQRIAWELELLHQARAIRQGNRDDFDFVSSRWKQAKENLLKESYKKCAYCEVYFSTVAYGDVEHYRPKSKYWWFAYAYLNYAAACQLCNQKYKRAEFPTLNKAWKAPRLRKNNTDKYLAKKVGQFTCDPLDNKAGMTLETFIQKHQEERPFALDPYIDEPADYFAYNYNDLTREVIMIPLNAEVETLVIACIELFGLNRKELCDLRYRGLINYRFYRQIIHDLGADSLHGRAARNIINNEFTHPKAEFAGMYQYFDKRDIDPIILI